MVKPFEDTAFKMAKGRDRRRGETDFGYHIQAWTISNAAGLCRRQRDKSPPRLQKQKATGALRASRRKKLNELAYQQADSLKAASDTLKLLLETSDWLARDQQTSQPRWPLKFWTPCSSDDVLKANTIAKPSKWRQARWWWCAWPSTSRQHKNAGRSRRQHSPDADQQQGRRTGQREGKTLLATLKAGKRLLAKAEPMQTVSRRRRSACRVTLHAWCSLPR